MLAPLKASPSSLAQVSHRSLPTGSKHPFSYPETQSILKSDIVPTALTMPFLSLPTKIILQILSLLDYDGLRGLTQQNRYLRSLPSSRLVRNVMINTELWDPGVFRRHDTFPYYSYLSVEKASEFSPRYKRERFRLGDWSMEERLCRLCHRMAFGREYR